MRSVSCVMVTRNRFNFWKRSVHAFLEQVHGNKELVVVVDRDPEGFARMQHYVEEHGIENVRLHLSTEKLFLGDLRNRSLDLADGEMVCQWDDDDLYHPERITRQLDTMLMSGSEVSFLAEHFAIADESNDLYLCDWHRTSEGGMPSTLLGSKRSLPQYPGLPRHEDTVFQRTLLRSEVRIANLRDLSGLHIYVCHGSNTSAAGHHRALWRSAGAEVLTLRSRREEISGWLKAYPSLNHVTVRSFRDEMAFQLTNVD